MARLYLRLLGSPQLQQGVRAVPLEAKQRDQLLCYLAYRSDWVSREQLQYLFWSEQESTKAQRNLRRLLARTREASWTQGLAARQHALCWQVDTDVTAFRQAIEASNWAEAVALYRGPFLENLEGNSLNEFTNWLELERDRLRASWRLAMLRQADALQAQGLASEAALLLKPLVENEALDDEVLKVYMQASAQAGGREQALGAYNAFTRRLHQELGLSPTAALVQLAQSLRSEAKDLRLAETSAPQDLASKASEANPGASLPTQNSSFVGRDLELAEMAELLALPECRLLTLLGLGGTGKTRTALKLAEQLASNYKDGVYFISLDPLSSATMIAPSIAEGLRLNVQDQADPLKQVITFIADKQLLLVLDNFEHLLAGAELAESLMTACPKLTLLVTSRERLNVEAEWLLPLGGLSYPRDTGLALEEVQYFDAPQLFMQRARRVKPDFALRQADLPQLLKLCQLLEGSPLGLELAAVWLRLMPLGEIVQEIATNIDFLSTDSRTKNPKHQSLQVVFEHSWQLLRPKEQEALRQLSVFRGGFDREAAKEVTGVALPLLAALVDKSLLRVSPTGRYDRHRLVYSYARAKLALQPEEKRRVEQQHAHYYLQLMQALVSDMHIDKHSAAWTRLELERANIYSAWDWASAAQQLNLVKASTLALSHSFNSRRQEGLTALRQASAHFDETKPEHRVVLAYLTVAETEQLPKQRFDADVVRERLEQALERLDPERDARAVLRALRMVAECEYTKGQFSRCQPLLEKALALARDYDFVEEVGGLLCALGLALRDSDAPEQTLRTYMAAAIEELRELKYESSLSYLLLIYGAHLVYRGRFDEGEALLKQSLHLASHLGGKPEIIPYIHIDLSRSAFERHAYDEAEALAQEALEQSTYKDRHAYATARYLLGRVATARADYKEARAQLRQSVHIAWEDKQWLELSGGLIFLAELEAAETKTSLALRYLSCILQQDAVINRDRAVAEKLIAQLRAKLSSREAAQAEERGHDMSLQDLVTDVLEHRLSPEDLRQTRNPSPGPDELL